MTAPPVPPAREPDKAEPPRPFPGVVLDVLFGRVATLVVALLALVLGVGSFAGLAGGVRLATRSSFAVGLSIADIAALLLLVLVIVGRVARVLLERKRGAAGARLHVRLLLLFGGVAMVPTLLVAIFAAFFFNLGIQAWFNERVRTALGESSLVAQGYLQEHIDDIKLDALGMANDLSRGGPIFFGNPSVFANFLGVQTTERGLTQAVIFDPASDQVVASAGLLAGMGAQLPPLSLIESARHGDIPVASSPDGALVHAVIQLDSTPPLMLMIERPIDPAILAHVQKTQAAVAEYNRLEHNRAGLEVSFALIFATVALLVLSAAMLIGLVLANQIARPIGFLMRAAERVRAGDLQVRVPERATGDELAALSRAFNRMTGQLGAQRAELMDAYGQLDERRRFTETVLAGVSAGVIGLDAAARIELPNRAARELLGLDLVAAIGRRLDEVVPEFASLLAGARAAPERPQVGEVEHGAAGRRVLLVRIGTELKGSAVDGFVVTFDDITALQTAQRKAAWADVARRIAHEIKNPLTPIQLSAERLKRRFAKEITSDPESFTQCADTIVRHVGDIGRMVDEFSSFARMPQPEMREEKLARIVREALVLPRTSHAEIAWVSEIEEPGPSARCDRRLIGQALTNLLQNAADSVAMRIEAGERPAEPGRIAVALTADAAFARIDVTDNGQGLPEQDRTRLTEPYVTHKPKGTGLGLAIVRKIMEDHGGRLELADAPAGPGGPARGAMVSLILPRLPAAPAKAEEAAAGEEGIAQAHG